jgi:hypothetical protein
MVDTAFYEKFLREEGFLPRIDEDGDVIFKFEGRTLFISVQESDAQYFRIVMPSFWEIDDEAELIQALRAANEINRKIKVATIVIQGDKDVSSNAEMFIEREPDLEQFFLRTVKVLVQAASDFSDLMRTGGALGQNLN